MPEPFRLFNTLTRKIEDFEPLEPGKVGLYVCGMTVYDHIHVGHARAMVVFDAFVRYLRHRSWEVRFVRNFTDVDDKIIDRAKQAGIAWNELAQHHIEAFYQDIDALGLARPDEEPRVSTSMEAIQGLVTSLIDRGHAYVADGNVWFSVETDDDYGKLSHQKVEELRNPDDWAGKRAAADFALWKTAKPGEPSWDSPWGPGRPGWHIECSAMCQSCLGDTIDIHGGGLDLVFPHHENEIAQSESGTGKPFARYWMHNGMLTISSGRKMKGGVDEAGGDGPKKMGKSLGNVVNVRDALAEYPGEALRLFYLQNQYRSPLPWDETALPEALAMLDRLYQARDTAAAMKGQEPAERVAEQLGKDAQQVLELGRSFNEKFYAACDHDFNTAKALGFALELARAINRFSNHKKAIKRGGPVVAPALAAFATVDKALGLLQMDGAAFEQEVKAKRLKALGLDQSWIEEQLVARAQARADKDWQRADAIRAELDEKRVEVLDRPDGVAWRLRLGDDRASLAGG
jgi:cysteinyl-tRNA synthetase